MGIGGGILIAVVHGAPTVIVWGTEIPKGEFLFVDDMAAACEHVMNLPQTIYDAHTKHMQCHINAGYGEDVSIRELAEIVAAVVGFGGEITFDPDKPGGMPRKLMDSRLLRKMGWHSRVDLQEGIARVHHEFLTRGFMPAHCATTTPSQ